MIKESPVNRSLSKRGLIILIVMLVSVMWGIELATRSQLVSEQKPLTNIANIETLRDQFNRDAGQIRLVILVSPT